MNKGFEWTLCHREYTSGIEIGTQKDTQHPWPSGKWVGRYDIFMRVAKIKTDYSKCRRGWEQLELIHCGQEYKMVQPLWKTVWPFLKKLNMHSPYDPAIPLLGICPKEMKVCVHTKTCTGMFVAAL